MSILPVICPRPVAVESYCVIHLISFLIFEKSLLVASDKLVDLSFQRFVVLSGFLPWLGFRGLEHLLVDICGCNCFTLKDPFVLLIKFLGPLFNLFCFQLSRRHLRL